MSKDQFVQVAQSTPFDNSTNGFVSEDTQAAIEEVNNKAKKIKAGIILAVTFTGTPRKAAVTFTTAYVDAEYAINITGIDARSWTYETKSAAGFTINTNANKALTGEVSWECVYKGEN